MPRTPGITDLVDVAAPAMELRQKAIANNLANLRRPGYLRQDVKFEELLADKLDAKGSRPIDLGSIKTEIDQPLTTPLGPDGNDVELDGEISGLMKNTGRYKLMMRLLKKTYTQFEMAMKTEG